MASSVLRGLVICLALGVVVTAATELKKSVLSKGTAVNRLEQLRNGLVEAKKKSATSELEDDIEGDAAENPLIPVKSSKVTSLLSSENTKEDKSVADDSSNDGIKDDGSRDDGIKDGSRDVGHHPHETNAADWIIVSSTVLSAEIEQECGIDIIAIFQDYSPATLAEVNNAQTNLLTATQMLASELEAAPGFADDLNTYLSSDTYQDSQVSANVGKTMDNIDAFLSTVHKGLFCAVARVIANRLKMSLYGGTGFANGYLCNKVFSELFRLKLNETTILDAMAKDKNFVKTLAQNLAADIECYEKELEAYQKVVPTTPYTAQSPLQVAAFTSDFLAGYGIILVYHRFILELEAQVIQLLPLNAKPENDVNKKELDEDGESLTQQLKKLLTKLNEVSEKKKAAEASLGQRSVAESSMPSAGQKTALKESYYKRRIN